jgi:hypothetical protein
MINFLEFFMDEFVSTFCLILGTERLNEVGENGTTQIS